MQNWEYRMLRFTALPLVSGKSTVYDSGLRGGKTQVSASISAADIEAKWHEVVAPYLNSLGKEGWDVVSTIQWPGAADSNAYLLKRPIP